MYKSKTVLSVAVSSLIFSSSLLASSVPSVGLNDISGTIGFLGYAGSSPYKGIGTVVAPVPIFNIEKGNFFARTGEVRYSVLTMGYKFFDNEQLKMSLLINPLGGYRVDGDDLDDGYNNIDDRKWQIEGGVRVLYNTGFEKIRLGAYALVGERGNQFGASAVKLFVLNQRFIIAPKLWANYFDSDYADYYFGVSQEEANNNSLINSQYKPSEGFTMGADVVFRYTMTPKWSLFGFVGVEHFSNDLSDSPLVERDNMLRTGIGASYKFN